MRSLTAKEESRKDGMAERMLSLREKVYVRDVFESVLCIMHLRSVIIRGAVAVQTSRSREKTRDLVSIYARERQPEPALTC
jgi:hypothetical protein